MLQIPSGVDSNTFTASEFVARTSETGIYGGFVTNFVSVVNWSVPLNDAIDSFNYTMVWGLNNGILSVTPTENNEFDDGAFSGSIASKVESSFPTTIANDIYLQALAQQAQPFPGNGLGVDCSKKNSDGQLDPGCYTPCEGVGDDPSQWPAALSGSNIDDSSWYAQSYCAKVAGELDIAAAGGAQNYGLTVPEQSQIQGILSQTRPNNANEYQNVRCNFYPTYEIPTVPGTRIDMPATKTFAQPTCEVVARAKRINVFPDKVQLVWFDGTDVAHAGTDEYTSEPFALYLALNYAGKGSQLCDDTPINDFLQTFGVAHATHTQ